MIHYIDTLSILLLKLCMVLCSGSVMDPRQAPEIRQSRRAPDDHYRRQSQHRRVYPKVSLFWENISDTRKILGIFITGDRKTTSYSKIYSVSI